MKKLFFLMAAAAALFTSCSKDDTIGGLSRGKVTFEVSAPELATRYGEGATATTLQYAVYDMVENTMVKTEKLPGKFSNGTASLSIDLVEGRTYEVAFWAESPDSPYFFDAEGKTISYAPNVTLTANNENYDAFFAYVGDDQDEKFEVGQTVNVTLKRPFAQLNIATNDTGTAEDLDVEVVKTAVKVKAYTSFNLQTGAVEGNKTDVEFGLATKMSGKLATPSANTENTYDWLSMNYILTDGTNTDVTFTFTDAVNGTEEAYTRTYTAVPAKRNYRTNIIGSILTDPTVFELDIEEGFTQPDEEYTVGGVSKVSTQQELLDAFATLTDNDPDNDVSEVILTGNIDLSNTSVNTENTSTQLTTRAGSNDHITIPTGKQISIDLGGYNITGTDITEKNFGLIQNNGTLSITNSASTQSSIKLTATVNSEWARYSAVISNNPGGVLNVSGDILIEHLGGTDMAFGIDNLTNGTIGDVYATIEGATIKSTYRAVRQFLNSDSKENSLTIKSGTTLEGTNMGIFFHDPSTKANKGTLIVEDGANIGTAYLFVTYGSTEWPVEVSIAASSVNNDKANVTSNNVPAGYSIVLEDGNYVVKKGWYASSDDELLAALDNAPDGTTIYIAADIEGDVVATQKEGVKITIEGQNKSYKGMITVNGGSSTPTTAGLTIKNLSFNAGSTNGDANIRLGDGSTATRYTCNVTVEGCTFNADEIVGVKSYTGGDKNLTIKNCTATSNAHSLAQLKGIDGVLIEDCDIKSVRGLCVNNSTNVVIENSTIDVQKYAVRYGEGDNVNNLAETYSIKNSSLESQNVEGDATIVLRGTADNSTLTIEDTTIEGDKQIDNTATNAIVIIEGVPTVNSAEGLAAVVAKGYTNINLADGSYDMPTDISLQGKELTIIGSRDAVIDASKVDERNQFVTGAALKFEGVTLNFGTSNYMGFANCVSLTYKDCAINGLQFAYNPIVFDNCDFNSNGAEHCVWTYGAKEVTFNDCDFTYADRCVNVYLDNGTDSVKVDFSGCKFTNSDNETEGAVEINSSAFPKGANVNFTNCTAPSVGDMVFISKWDGTSGKTATVTVDGQTYNTPVHQ